MNKMILEIINFDHECVKAVDEAKKKKEDVLAHINEKKQEIYDSYSNEYELTLKKKKDDLEKEVNEAKRLNDEKFKKSKALLEETYLSNKDKWITSIVNNCKEI